MSAGPLAERFLERAGAGGPGPPARGVRIRQRGRIWTRPGARPLGFVAVQEIDAARVAFRWRARLGAGPLRPLTVVDAYDDGDGLLEGRVAGVRAFRSEGPEVTRGEAMRYLAELAWNPHALRANAALEWAELSPSEAEVATATRGGRAAVRLRFDEAGDLVRASSRDRPRAEGGRAVPTPWRGEFSDHADLGGLRVPRRAEVAWELPDGPFTYWRGEVTGLELVGPAAQR
ncbi:MAG TPA: DUF6544 family protein [Miltoncostaeaceae bacterium]|nr:DUF6544 family protein [Miltoncostaeaceae bacterium]